MFKAGVLGEYEKVCSFSVLGFDIIVAENQQAAKKELLRMLNEDYLIIYVSTEFFTEVKSIHTAVLPLPDLHSNLGIERLNKFAEKAVGSNI